MTQTDDLIGKTIGGCTVEARIGKGGMATVYRATQTSMGRAVALKVLPRELMQDDTYLARFEREVAIVAQLEHRSIVPVYDHGEHEGQPFIVMRYMPGGSVDRLLGSGPLPVQRALDIIQQIAPALDYAHSKGVLHRDLKPSNVLLDDDGGAYLTDFGIARITGQESAGAALTTQGVVGTPAYMSPEQAQGHAMDGRSDVYALGVMLFEMATGRRPFHSETPYSIAVMQVTTPPPTARSFNPQLSLSVEAVIAKALRKRPDERYQSAQGLAEALAMAVEAPASSLHDTQPRIPREAVDAARRMAAGATVPHSPPSPAPSPPSPAPSPAPVPSVPPPIYSRSDTDSAARPTVPPPQRAPQHAPQRGGLPAWMGIALGGLIGCGLLAVVTVGGLMMAAPLLGGQDPPTATAATTAATAATTATVATAATATTATTEAPTRAPVDALESGSVLYFAERRLPTADDDDARSFALVRRSLSVGIELQLTADRAANLHPDPSPDGARVVFQSDRDGDDYDLYTVTHVGGDIRQLFDSDVDEWTPDWSPDGAWIAFAADLRADGSYDLFRVRPDGSDLEPLYTDDALRASTPRWSPDGQRLVFTLGQARDARTWDIAILDLASGEVTRLMQDSTRQAWPVFSADGQAVYYVTGEGDSTAIARIAADGQGRAERLHSAGDFIWGLDITPDGAYLSFNAGAVESASGSSYALALSDDSDTRQVIATDGGVGLRWWP